jgi:menaquinone-dependent protoporphyrinogen oxidase
MNTMSILLAYAPRFGSTQEAAEIIATTLREVRLKVDLQPIQGIKTLANYDAVVLGAGLYNGRWNLDVHNVISQYQETLSQSPVAIFTLGPLSGSDAAIRNSRRQLDSEMAKYLWLKPVAVEIFAGKYDPSKTGLGFFERFLPTRDYRNWDAMHKWAIALPAKLQQSEVLQPAK